MKTIITNRVWFRKYLLFRNIILGLTLATLLAQFAGIEGGALLQLLSATALSLLLVLLLFDYLQRPGLLEIFQNKEGLIIKLYQPDSRLMHWWDEQRIRTFLLDSPAQLQVYGQYERLPWRKKIQLVVQLPDGSQAISERIDVSWASKSQLQRLIQLNS